MKPTTGGARDLFPQGEELRRAVLWISESRKTDPDADPLRIIDEASVRFDLTPLQVEYLLAMVRDSR